MTFGFAMCRAICSKFFRGELAIDMAGVKEEPAFVQPATDSFMVGVLRDAPEAFRSGDPGD